MSYSTTEVAMALGTSQRVIDNLFVRDAKHLITPGSRGRARLIDEQVIEILALSLLVRRDLGTSLRRAVGLAEQILSARSAEVRIGSLGVLRFDLPILRRVLRQALSDAVEDSRPVRRGRIPGKAKRGASL